MTNENISRAVLITGRSTGIGRALDAANPRPRYSVTPSAKVVLTLRRILPDRLSARGKSPWRRFPEQNEHAGCLHHKDLCLL